MRGASLAQTGAQDQKGGYILAILILYATVEGQTAKIARFVADEIRKAGAEPILFNADDPDPVSFEGVEKVILAASVHERRHPKAFEVILAAESEALGTLPTLLLSVSLNAAFPEGLSEAREYIVEMNMRTGFTPKRDALVAGAVRSGEYDYFAAQVVEHVVLRGRDDEDGGADQEFTDWAALAETVASFLAEDA